jgi:hypothetical protein
MVEHAGDGGLGVEAMVSMIDGDDPDNGKPAPLASALLETLRRLVRPGNARVSAQRFIGLCLILIPDVLRLSQTSAARQLLLTRSSLSKVTLKLGEEFQLGHSRWQKRKTTRQKYAAAQRLAYQQGRHASLRRRATARPG